jgi:hypothetical protein
MAVDYWINGKTSLFWFSPRDGALSWLGYVEILRIRWVEEDETLLWLKGYLPMASDFLSGFSNRDELYLRYVECGNPSDPSEGDLIMTFKHCEIQRKWIDHPVVLNPADQEGIAFYMRLKCRFELP